METLLEELFNQAGLEINAWERASLARHWRLLYAANQQFNLTAIQEDALAAEKHYLDSLLPLAQLREAAGGRQALLADIGSGGGLPALPLAICLPDFSFTLLEATGKKCAFLAETVEKLALANVSVRKLRAEEAGRDPALRAGFDFVTARAVARLPVLLEYALPLLKPGGRFFAYKGAEAGLEVRESSRALAVLGGKISAVHDFTLPLSKEQRTVIQVTKEKKTPDRYPRRPGMPGKAPL